MPEIASPLEAKAGEITLSKKLNSGNSSERYGLLKPGVYCSILARVGIMKQGIGKRLAVLFATGFGLGFSPVASGTVGTCWGVLLVLLLRCLPWALMLAVVIALLLAGVYVCDIAEKVFQKKDDGRIVADEYLSFPLCVIGLPWPDHLWILVAAFFLHRFFDIVKPPPARRLQDLPGGWGIVLDDVAASLYALATLHAAWWFLR